jgi:hypothetical protein
MNSKTSSYKATPMSRWQPIDKSDEPAKSAGQKMKSDKPWKAANPTYGNSTMVPTSPVLKAIPKGGTKSHPNLKAKTEIAGPTYGNSKMVGQPKSGDLTLGSAADKLPSKWNKKNKYSMSVPAAVTGRLKSKWEQ